jgi:hypothetical protein
MEEGRTVEQRSFAAKLDTEFIEPRSDFSSSATEEVTEGWSELTRQRAGNGLHQPAFA